jgi:prolipoprotein diacylglyceryl transferase
VPILSVPTLLATIPPPPAPGLQLGPLDLRFYGVLIAIGAYVALRLAVSRYEKLGGDPELAERALLVGLVFGLIGSRIGYVIPRTGQFLEQPLEIFAIWQGGLTIFGGLIFGALAAVIYMRRKQMDIPGMLTAAAPALPLAQAIGRWGNYFNQELYGRPTELPWALEVEERFRRPGYEAFSTFHPTFLYESLWNLSLVATLLWIDRRGTLKRGSLMFVYLIGYGIGRAWIEALRVDTDWRLLGLSRNNWNAVFFILIGIVGLWWWERRATVADAAAEPGAVEPALDGEAARRTEDAEPAGDGAGDAAARDRTEGSPAGGDVADGGHEIGSDAEDDGPDGRSTDPDRPSR